MKDPSKVRKIANLLLRTAIFAIACLFLVQRVFSERGLHDFFTALRLSVVSGSGIQLFWLAVVLVMMPVNWGLEARKWSFLIVKTEKVPFGRAFQAVLAGLAVSSFIPNRAGEFLGRIYMLRTAGRIEAILMTLVGSVSQLLVTLLAGSVALLIFLPGFLPGTAAVYRYLYVALAVFLVVLNLSLLGLFFRMSFLSALRERLLAGRLKRFRKYLRVFAFYRNGEIARVILLSMARYLVFSGQFYLLLRLSGVVIPYLPALMLIALVYLIMAFIPTIALTELGVRGSVAVAVFGSWATLTGAGDPGAGVLGASTLLWVINLGVPTLAGSFLVFRLRFFRKTATG